MTQSHIQNWQQGPFCHFQPNISDMILEIWHGLLCGQQPSDTLCHVDAIRFPGLTSPGL